MYSVPDAYKNIHYYSFESDVFRPALITVFVRRRIVRGLPRVNDFGHLRRDRLSSEILVFCFTVKSLTK